MKQKKRYLPIRCDYRPLYTNQKADSEIESDDFREVFFFLREVSEADVIGLEVVTWPRSYL